MENEFSADEYVKLVSDIREYLNEQIDTGLMSRLAVQLWSGYVINSPVTVLRDVSRFGYLVDRHGKLYITESPEAYQEGNAEICWTIHTVPSYLLPEIIRTLPAFLNGHYTSVVNDTEAELRAEALKLGLR